MKQGDYVRTRAGVLAKIVWEGQIPGRGYVFGLQLEEWSEKGNDGSYNGKHYFKTKPGYGLFTYKKNLTPAKAPAKKKSSESGIAIGDYVKLRNGKEGTVMFVGCLRGSTNEVVGVKLPVWSESGHDGKGYFSVPNGYGYFTKPSVITSCSKKSGKNVDLAKPKPKVEEKKQESAIVENEAGSVSCNVGDMVRLARGREGIVKFIGKVGEKKLCGLELAAWSEKGNDGMLKGVRYFTCQPGRGYFTAYTNVSEVLKRATQKEKLKERSPSFEKQVDEKQVDSADIVKIALGDKVQLRKGRVGFVRYIGKVKGKRGEIVGLELLQWFDRGHNGTYNDEKYYTCKDGTGYWTSRSAVATVLSNAGNSGGSRRSSRTGSVTKARSNSGLTKTRTKSVELDEPILKFEVGDTVRLKKGREGVVKYYDKKSQIVGMELTNWNADCGDGTFKGKEYFKCDKGRGYFTTAKAVSEILKRVSKPCSPRREKSQSLIREKSQSLSIDDDAKVAPVKFELGDKVRLHRGKIGTVKYIGKTGFSKGKVVGLELDSWYEKGNDGSVQGKRFFVTKGPGWGYFTKPSAIAEVLDKKAP